MISNLANQLREQGALDKMNLVMKEIPRVREDLGYPPLVTPTSQIVGTQAVMNVLTGERYKTITNEVKLYLQGRYGRTLGTVNSVVRQKAIGNAEVIDCRPADLLDDELENLREQAGELAQSEEDVLIFAMFPEVGREFLQQRRDGHLVPEPLLPANGGKKEDQAAPVEFRVTLHGETYHIKVTGTGHKREDMRPFYVTVDGMPEEIQVETLDELLVSAEGGDTAQPRPRGKGSQRPRATKPGHVSTSMPGNITDVLVKEGDTVKAGDAVLVLEAMKMETEVQAPVDGTVKAVHVAKGDSVNPDETLVEIE